MDYRRKLFLHRHPYDHVGTDSLFLEAVRQNTAFHRAHCPAYAEICDRFGFDETSLSSAGDLWRIPPLTTLYLKGRSLSSMPGRRGQLFATSSGTNGKKTTIGFDLKGLYWGFYMVLRLSGFHHLRSVRPTNYIVLGYQPVRSNQTAVSKTAFGSTLFAPALRREYAIKYDGSGYQVDLEGVRDALIRFSRVRAPVRLIGFPAYAWFLMRQLQKEGLSLRLPAGSKMLLGGGWKQFYREQVEKSDFYALAEATLGLSDRQCTEFFGAVEHPILYCDCPQHRFHVPIYSRVIIRDVRTLQPVSFGQPGLVNLITPMMESAPLTSVMTDDIGILRDGAECGCGISTPTLELLGRAGLQNIKTCAAGAGDLLGGTAG